MEDRATLGERFLGFNERHEAAIAITLTAGFLLLYRYFGTAWVVTLYVLMMIAWSAPLNRRHGAKHPERVAVATAMGAILLGAWFLFLCVHPLDFYIGRK